MLSLRKRLETSPLAARLIARLVGTYLRFCNWTIRWKIEGLEDLERELAAGPVLLVCWHGQSLMAPVHWPVETGQLTSLYANSAIGRVSGAMQKQFGLHPMKMSNQQSNMTASRAVLKRVREGVSIGMTADGPLGPALEVKDAPLDWARATQRPVWGYAFETSRGRALPSWDEMWLPYPFGTGRIVFRKWDIQMPRKVEAPALSKIRSEFADHLNDLL